MALPPSYDPQPVVHNRQPTNNLLANPRFKQFPLHATTVANVPSLKIAATHLIGRVNPPHHHGQQQARPVLPQLNLVTHDNERRRGHLTDPDSWIKMDANFALDVVPGPLVMQLNVPALCPMPQVSTNRPLRPRLRFHTSATPKTTCASFNQ